MNILEGVKRLGQILLLLSFASFTASPITSLLGIQQPTVQSTSDTIRYFMVAGFIIMVIAVAAVFGFGYIILTGWREHRRIPKAVQLLLAFALGALAFSLSGPISLVLPIPFLPTVLTTILLWGVLRAVSNAFPSNEQDAVEIGEAIASARNMIKQVEPSAQNLDILNSKANGKCWKVSLLSHPSSKKYEVEIDMQDGDVTGWKSA
jgi:hypothetical protein